MRSQTSLFGERPAVADRDGSSLQAALSGERPVGRMSVGGSPKQPKIGMPLAITCGDPAGVGPELIERILGDEALRREFASGEAEELSIIGPGAWLATLPEIVEKVPVGDSALRPQAGVPSEAGARVALEAMECAAAGCVSGRFSGVVTGPVSKAELAKIGYPFPGQTEFFAARWGSDECGNASGDSGENSEGGPVMGFVGERLRVVLATWHVPLAEVPHVLDERRLTRAVAAAAQLAGAQTFFSDTSSAARVGVRIAVCGLNPHAGEGGLLGVEERDLLNPILAKLSPRYPGLVPQCLPGDTVFARALRGEFDVVVALYHDQGLAPLKAVDFDTAVNVTLGLPFVRTSPDHGTAFDLAGKGTASPRSFANAIRLARNLLRERSYA